MTSPQHELRTVDQGSRNLIIAVQEAADAISGLCNQLSTINHLPSHFFRVDPGHHSPQVAADLKAGPGDVLNFTKLPDGQIQIWVVKKSGYASLKDMK